MNVRSLLLSSVAALGLALAATAAAAQAGQTIQADARTALSGGLRDAGQAASGMVLESSLEPAPGFFDPEALFAPPQTEAEGEAYAARMRDNPPRYGPLALANTDMAISNGRLFVGNFNGFNAYDISSGPPRLVMSVVCPGGQGDVSVHGNLLFMSVEQNRGRLDCGTSGAEGDVNAERFRGVRIFDISDLNAPRQIAAVQTCRGSHTHTLVPDPTDPRSLYVYNQGTSGVRKTGELAICSDGQPDTNPDTALFSIDVIKVNLDRPQDAAIVNRPRIFADASGRVAGLWRGGAAGLASQRTAQTNQCHDITVYPEIGLAAGACSGNGILLDISDPQNPTRLSDIFDPDMAYWHSATFNNAGDKVVFTDEWGGGIGARCQATDPATWGANMVATIDNRTLTGRSFHKLPSAQGATENCVAHNGNLIPVPGRDLMVQAWYQGGVSVMDFTDPLKPVEIAWFDRGPIDADKLIVGGSWSAYWLNGRIYSSEIARGLDVLKLVPGDQLSAAEIAAAESVMADEINPQTQTRFAFADHPDVAEAYLDQLARAPGADTALNDRIRAAVGQWRAGRADRRGSAALATALTAAADKATGADKGRMTALAAMFGRRAG
ncbi:LVIVD repeat-containing protein [Brevundimonas sp. TWP2-3-4b2]|uniref:LVIVD repeat-containing protein n=1 Tax=Brevundimonas sp. TWP2-3-4b2 TaxID=2804595 RepID=UPI003CFA4B6B